MNISIVKRVVVIGGVVGFVLLTSLGAVKAHDYYQVNQLVKAADSLMAQEKYQDALNQLDLTQAHWTVHSVRQQITTKIATDKELLADQDSFTKGNDLFTQSRWQEAKDSFSKVSGIFPQYKEAQDKLLASQQNIDEAVDKQQAAQQKQQAEADARTKADAAAKALADAQQQKQVNTPPAVVSDPYPTPEDYSSCGPLPTDFTKETSEQFSCVFHIDQKNAAAVRAWNARHGIVTPEQPIPTSTPYQPPKTTNCRWIGTLWTCTTY